MCGIRLFSLPSENNTNLSITNLSLLNFFYYSLPINVILFMFGLTSYSSWDLLFWLIFIVKVWAVVFPLTRIFFLLYYSEGKEINPQLKYGFATVKARNVPGLISTSAASLSMFDTGTESFSSDILSNKSSMNSYISNSDISFVSTNSDNSKSSL